MNDAGLVGGSQRSADLFDDLGDQGRGQMARAGDEFRQWLSLGPLQRQVMQSVGLTIVVGADNARVTDPRTVFRLAKKPLDGNGILGQAGAKDLHGRHSALRVLSAVNSRGSA